MVQNTIYTQILKTKDYSQFSLLKENRDINDRNYGKLVASMKEELLVIPIVVNEQMQIIDGQHRFTACKELKLPIYYFMVEGYGIDQVRRANMVGANWTKNDYLNMYVSRNEKAYIEFKGLIVRHGLSVTNMLKIFAKVQGNSQALMGKDFDEGTLTLDGLDEVVEFLIALNDFDFFEDYKRTSFTIAFIELYFHPDYNHEIMKTRLIRGQSRFEKKSTAGEYLAMLTKDVYSFGAVKEPLYYDAEIGRFFTV